MGCPSGWAGTCDGRRMRCPLCYVLVVLTLLCNVLLLYYTWHLHVRPAGRPPSSLSAGVTVIVREFRPFEHGLAELHRSFLRSRPSLHILVASETAPYPPVPGITLLRLHPYPEQPGSASRLESHVRTRLVALVPDGCALDPPDLLERMARGLRDAPPGVRLVAAGAGAALHCLHLNVSQREWTAQYRAARHRGVLRSRVWRCRPADALP
ncbi:unnamed protein product [Ranitomeya imitator]|uniref:FKRP stem domain-containing protein n=1 Tax=Ranitomeya imitator TaxID=111125 RepID=A0ABN9KRE0_9NEOB|nr:unnamed protein product [Ranitomeya imitator]